MDNDSGKSTPLSDDIVPTPRHMEFTTNAELNLSCCILMLDILLKQVKYKSYIKNHLLYILIIYRISFFYAMK